MILKLTLAFVLLLMLSACEKKVADEAEVAQTPQIKKINKDITNDIENLAKNSKNSSAFATSSLKIIKDKVLDEYVPKSLQDKVVQSDVFNVDNLAKNETIKTYMDELYVSINDDSKKSSSLRGVSDIQEILAQVINTIKDMIFEWVNSFFTFGDGEYGNIDENASDDDIYVPKDDTPIEFTLDLVKDKTFYVISSKVDMSVKMSKDGLSGSGSMGIISMDFTDYISTDGLMISTELMGDWTIDINYLDEGYCIAADAISEGGDVYESYWFSNKSDESKATTLKSAKKLCYAHASADEVVEDKLIDEGSVVAIGDTRGSHNPQSGINAKDVVESLMGLKNSIDINDAKYFARSMRKGPLSLYTTNHQTHDLLSLESGNIMRELMPQAMSSAINMKTLLEDSYKMALGFQGEVTNDLNSTLNLFNDRMQKIAQAAAIAMDKAVQSKSSGSVTTSYGDKVTLAVGNLNVNICLLFFMCESSVDGDAYFMVQNDGTSGNKANIAFKTHFNAESMDVSAVQFNRVISNNSINTISGDGYSLNLSGFAFNRNEGTLDLEGMGNINSSKTPVTTADINNFDIRVYVQEQGALNFVPRALSAALNTDIKTAQGRDFSGKLYFDAQNTQNNELNGTIKGKDGEPTIKGEFKTSLTFQDIDWWVNGRDDINFDKGMPYLVDQNGNIELLSSLTNFSRVEAKTFETFDNRYNCTKNSDETYACSDPFNKVHKTVKFLTNDQVLKVNTNDGEYYVVAIENIRNYSLSNIVMFKDDASRKIIKLGEFDYKKASISNVRVVSANINPDYTIDNIGEHSYSMKMDITRGTQSLSADMLMKNKLDDDTWEYYLKDLKASDDFGKINASRIYISQTGSNQLVLLLDELMDASFNLDFDIESMLNLGWESLSPFKNISLDDFEMIMQGSLGEAKFKTDMNFVNNISRYDADANASYSYGTTNITTDVNASVELDGQNAYKSVFSANGEIKAENHPDYKYMVDYTNDKQYLVLERKDTSYQMGFVVNGLNSKGADSYGVKADFTTNETMDTLEKMTIKNNSGSAIGRYDKSLDDFKIFYPNAEFEYLYIY